MRIYVDDIEFIATHLEGDRFEVDNNIRGMKTYEYLKDWMLEVINHEPNTVTYKRDTKFSGYWGVGKLYGCFPIRMNPDTIIIAYDRIEYK